jgi:transposase InsO family protein
MELTMHGHLHLEDQTRWLLLQMSPSAAGRLLVGEGRMYRLHVLCHTRSTPLGGRIPVQTCMNPPLLIPCVLVVDLVGRGGGQVTGDFGWTLTVTDCTTGRPQAGAVRTNAEVVVVAVLASCLRRYPGIVSLHSDNGSEFMNGYLTRFCGARDITFTRSRPYQGNDNAETLCARMPARKDVLEQTKERLQATRAEPDMTSLLHEIFLC